MRHRPEVLLIGALAAFALTGSVALLLERARGGADEMPPAPPVVIAANPAIAATWFALTRPHCNPVEVETHLQVHPPPPEPDVMMYVAACFALAGRTDLARGIIDGLPAELRAQAAGVVFEAGHPAADAGDDVAAGPLMELVVDYWPNHYMALYHAGAARYDLGDYARAQKYLETFMAEYGTEDGWRSSAREMLERIAEQGRWDPR